ncbi:hypothetical protein [Pseudomonas protegens]|uniref:hypothetical protein n=1 Tax=Pseudomonas protegens TaxID=380021 RepID=UPI0011AFBA4E|nr:hypothetical protein [Pseudomonas protegens]
MDKSAPLVRNASRPALVTFALIYCLFLTLKISYWLASEGWDLARMGDIWPIWMLAPVLTCILLTAGGLLLWCRSEKSSRCLLGALLLGPVLIPSMMPEILRVPASMYVQVAWYVLPATLKAALLIGVWFYSHQLRRTGYFN